MTKTVTLPSEAVADAVAVYTIGSAKLETNDGVENAVGAGSGTLVLVGKVRGILTAAHVLAALPDQGVVGIVEYVGRTPHYRKRTIDMGHTTKIVLRKDEFGPEGPDLGFLRLSPDTFGWFEAIGSFYNLLKHRTDADGAPPSPDFTDAVVGMIEERTKDYPADRAGGRRKGYEALFSNGSTSAFRTVEGFELFDFAPTTYPDFKLTQRSQRSVDSEPSTTCLRLETNRSRTSS